MPAPDRNPDSPALRRAQRSAALFAGLCLGLAALLVWTRTSSVQAAGPRDEIDGAMLNPEVRREAIRRLMDLTAGFYDSFPDPDVGRVLQPELPEFEREGLRLASNSFGLREKEYALPKAADTMRVVLLGDSFVMGSGVNREDRLGVFLEEALNERRQDGGANPIEVLHLGLGSWNIRAECAFLRRQLSLLQPDLVVHITVGNDLDDSSAIRGFGVLSDFSSQHRGRANSLMMQRHPREMGFSGSNWISSGLDYESRQRYAEAADDLQGLHAALEARGIPYQLLLRWSDRNTAAREHLASWLGEDAKLYLPRSFDNDPAFRLAKSDPHWNRAGHKRLAELIYGRILEGDLLPALQLAPWPEASDTLAELGGAGAKEAAGRFPLRGLTARSPIEGRIDFQALQRSSAAQVHGGVHGDGTLSVYASMILRRGEAKVLKVVAEPLGRSELARGRTQVFVDEYPVGELALGADKELTLEVELPAEVLDRDFLSLRFEATDYAYEGEGLRRCVTLRLRTVELL